ncbi:MAG TPA: hypothetical protein VNZ52_09375 [Candidatus Thermoplasmatota archaeon]|nr:hypothetical protein [Candidatus Thermoplasmatota archaeon]
MPELTRSLAAFALVALLLLQPGALAAEAPERPLFPAALRTLSERADTLRAEVEAEHGNNTKEADALASFRAGHRAVGTYNGTPLAGFALNGLAKMEAARGYLEYQEKRFGFLNVSHIDLEAQAVRAKGNATRDRLFALERSHATVAGLDLLVYAGTYAVQGDLSVLVYERTYRHEATTKTKVDARYLPGMYGELALASVCYDYVNLLLDELARTPATGPSPRPGALQGATDKAMLTLADVKNGRVEEWLVGLAKEQAEEDHLVYPIAARLLQIRATNLTAVQFSVRIDQPQDAPGKLQAAAKAASILQANIPGGFRDAGFPGYLARETHFEVGHYLNRTDTESLQRAYAGAAMLDALPGHLGGLTAQSATASSASRVPAVAPLAALAVVGAFALLLGRRSA